MNLNCSLRWEEQPEVEMHSQGRKSRAAAQGWRRRSYGYARSEGRGRQASSRVRGCIQTAELEARWQHWPAAGWRRPKYTPRFARPHLTLSSGSTRTSAYSTTLPRGRGLRHTSPCRPKRVGDHHFPDSGIFQLSKRITFVSIYK